MPSGYQEDLSVTSPGEESETAGLSGENEPEPHPGLDGAPVRCKYSGSLLYLSPPYGR